MAIFQPSNVIPSTFAGFGLGTIDSDDNVNISWQVNGNSPMTAFQIQIYDSSLPTNNLIHDTGLVSVGNGGFYGVDNKGNPKQFVYAPVNANETPKVAYKWSDWGIIDGNEYKMFITQFWGSENSNSVNQWSASVFLSRTAPTLSLKYIDNGSSELITDDMTFSNAVIVFTATYEQAQNDSINSVRWQLYNDDNEIIDDTGLINTGELAYTYNQFFTGNTYSLKCTIETQNGVQISEEVSFDIEYSEAVSSGNLTAECSQNDSVLLNWGKAVDIPGELSPTGSPEINDSFLTLTDEQNVTWNKLNDESFDFQSPWSIGWKGLIGSSLEENISIELQAEKTSSNQTLNINSDTYNLEEYKTISLQNDSGTKYFAYGNNKFVCCTSGGNIYNSTDGVNWSFIINLNLTTLVTGLVYDTRNSKFVFVSNMRFGYSTTGGANWTTFDSPKTVAGITVHSWRLKQGRYGLIVIASPFSNSNDSKILTSTDITTWSNELQFDNLDDYFYDIAQTDNGYYVLLGRDNIYYGGWQGSISIIPNDYNLTTIDYGNSCFIAVSSSVVSASDDGVSWRIISSNYNTNYTFTGVRFGNGVFLISTSRGIGFTTKTGENLLSHNIGASQPLYSTRNISFAQGLFFLSNTTNSQIYLNKLIYTSTQTLQIDGWLRELTFNNNSIVSLTYSEQGSANNPVVLTIKSIENNISLTINLTIYSATSTGTKTINFTNGQLSNINITTQDDSAIISKTINGNLITLTARASTPKTQNNINLLCTINYTYNDTFNSSTNPILNLSNYTVSLKKNLETGGYSLSIGETSTPSYILDPSEFLLPSHGTYKIFGTVIIDNSKAVLVLSNQENTINQSIVFNLDYTQPNITSISLTGPQIVDFVIVQSNSFTDNNLIPSWNENTLLLADFNDNNLQAGTVSVSGTFSNSIYRIDNDGNFKFIANVPTAITELKDFGTISNKQYSYELFYLSAESGFSQPIMSNKICKQSNSYLLIKATQDLEDANVFHVNKVWRFGNNVSAGSISNNNTPNWLTNFTPYRLKQPSSRLGQSGTLQALLNNYNQSENFYEDTVEMMNELKEASISNDTFFLKDIKGNLYMVGISGPIVQTINTKSKIQEVKVSIPWEEVGDTNNVSLIQLPTDEGWQQDGVFDVLFDVDLTSGMLNVTYPNNYVGTTFALEENNLIASTPSGVKSATLSINDGEVIATKN